MVLVALALLVDGVFVAGYFAAGLGAPPPSSK